MYVVAIELTIISISLFNVGLPHTLDWYDYMRDYDNVKMFSVGTFIIEFENSIHIQPH